MNCRIPPHTFVLLCALVLSACTSTPDDPFDRQAMLSALGENVFVPTYEDFATSASALRASADVYCGAQDEASLAALHDAFAVAHFRFKLAESFAIGPHTDNPPRLGPQLDDWPSEESDVRELLSGTETLSAETLSAMGNRVQGFAALDYVLSGPDDELGAWEVTPRRCEYASALSARIASLADAYVREWRPDGADHVGELSRGDGRYPSPFLAVSILVEQMVYTIENIRELKVGKPFGKRDGGELQPEQFEVPYGRLSNASALAALQSVRNVYEGRYVALDGSERNGLGFQDWLISRRPELDALILSAFDGAEAAQESVVPDLESAITDAPDTVEAAYQAVKELQMTLAIEFAGALSITVTFNPTDGD